MCDLTMQQRTAIAGKALSTAELEAFMAWHRDQPVLVQLWIGVLDACLDELADCQAAIAAGIP